MSSSALYFRYSVIWHAFRHDSVLPYVMLADEGPFRYAPTHRLTIDVDIERTLGLPRHDAHLNRDWPSLTADRLAWKTCVERGVRLHEERSWSRYYKKSHSRWASRSASIAATYALHYTPWATLFPPFTDPHGYLGSAFPHQFKTLTTTW